MKDTICTVIGLIGGAIAALFGGWDTALQTLVIFMAIDYITGLVVAGVFHASPKTKTGALESKAGWKGLIRKGETLLIVLVACQLDAVIGGSFVRDAAIIGFSANEAISIVENAGLMGLPIPAAITKAIDILKQRTDITKETADVFIGLAHFAFSTGSKEKVDAMIEQFRSDGYKIVGEPRITGDGYYEGAVLDPDGNIVEVIA